MVMNTESIAITGVSGRFPNCSTVEELQAGLYNGTDLITTNHTRWSHESLKTCHRLGLVHDFEHFDAAFFGINPKEANTNDPRLRKILEVTYEAIIDAGLNPTELRGTRVGVFLGVSPNDISDLNYKGGLLARSAAIMANVVSYCFDFKGPSLAINTACSSSLFAFNHAVESIVCERCDIAIVGAVQHQIDPAESVELLEVGVLHTEGISRPFDVNRKGYVKSEGIAAVVLQKVDTCKRIYATIAGVGTNVEGFKRDGMAHPSRHMQRAMFEDVFKQFNLDPLDVNYVETHCTGTVVGDVEEVEAIDQFYTKQRKTPLLIGSIKSNLGHTETTSGLVSLIKMVLAIREGVIPGNLNYQTPDPQMKGICEGRIKVVDKNTPLPDGLIAINSFGFGGANGMIVLRPYKKNLPQTQNLTHRFVHISGRTEEGLQLLFDTIIKNKANNDFLSLVDNIYSKPIENHNHRGYAVLTNNSHYEISQVSSKKRPIWFLYAGFGSQWPQMGKDLMSIKIFKNTILKCAEALKPYEIDLEDVINNTTDADLDDLTKTFPAITAISVALTDLLTSMNIRPDGIFGHSLGEVGCAYADGLITATQAVLLSFSRAYAAQHSGIIHGAMAAIALSPEECTKLLPDGIHIACENSEEHVTVSGPRKLVLPFLEHLNSKGIFNRLISNSNFPFHCPYIKPAGSKMHEIALKALPGRKLRSDKWLSSSFPEDKWKTDLCRYNSADYHLHNYLNKVYFSQVLKYIPKDAIVIEVAPRGLLQGVAKRAVDPSITFLSLLKPGVDNLDFFWSNIGKYFNNGGQLDVREVYKPVKFPVSINTPMLASLVKWDHRIKWYSLKYNAGSSFGAKVSIDMNDKENDYLEGHVADGRLILPAAGYIVLVWETFAKMLEVSHEKLPVKFENVKTLRPVLLHKSEATTLIINIFKSTGLFEVCLENDEKNVVASGKITVWKNVAPSDIPISDQNQLKINHQEFYMNLKIRGFDYGGIFKGVQECDVDGTSAKVKWYNNWTAFMDTVVHYMLSVETTGHCLPTIFERVIINPLQHLEGKNSLLTLRYDQFLQSAQCGGVEIKNVTVTNLKKREASHNPTLRKYIFVPNDDTQNNVDLFHHSLNVAVQIVIDNCLEDKTTKISEFGGDSINQLLKTYLDKVHYKNIKLTQLKSLDDKIPDTDLLVVLDKTANVSKYMTKARFIFAQVSSKSELTNEIVYQNHNYVLMKASQHLPTNYTIITANNNNFNWFQALKDAIKKYQSPKSRIYLINNDLNSGILGLFNTSRLEQFCPNLRIFLIRSNQPEPFSLNSKFYLPQLTKDLAVNVYQNGVWGTYRRLPLPTPEAISSPNAVLVKDKKSVRWLQKSPFGKDNISVYFASITKREQLIITERSGFNLEKTQFLGCEFSGIDKNKNNVMGLVADGASSKSLQAHPKLVWNFADKLSFEEAATIPLAYTLSYYGLFVRTNLSSKDSILIANSTSDFSLAAIALSLAKGCSVFTLADSNQKILLKSLFPMLNEDNMIDSDVSSIDRILLRKTKGFKAIFNSNLEQLKDLKPCLAQTGCFVEVCNNPMEFLVSEASKELNGRVHNINLDDLLAEDDETLDAISTVMEMFIKTGVTIPLKYTVFRKDDLEEALKHVEDSNQTVKCLVSLQKSAEILAQPTTWFDPNKSYVIVGGLGGFGFELAKWLVERGATKLILNSRKDVRSGYQARYLQKWKKQKLLVLINTSDSSSLEGAKALMSFALNVAPVGGIFNTALQVQDELLKNLTPDDFKAVAASKIYSAQNLDELSRQYCRSLDFFVMFSSLASSVGNHTQGNYAFVNSAVERLCESRKADGLPGLTIEWGPLAEVGIMARLNLNVQFIETSPQKIGSCLECVDQFLQVNEPVLTSCVYVYDEDEVSKKKSLVEMVVNLFGIKNVEEIDESKSLVELGMDSLLAFEIKHLLRKEAGVDVIIDEIRNMTVEQVKHMSS